MRRPTRSASEASIARSNDSLIVSTDGSADPNDSANFEALSSLMASRRPTFIWPSSKAVSVPGRADPDQYRTASVPCCSSSAIGVTTLPFDFDIFLRSGSRIHPDSAAFDHGTVSNS